MTALLGLFAAAFVAATIVPAQSEALLAYLVVEEDHALWVLLVVATLGNVLGSVVNWVLGRGASRLRNKPWFPVSPAAMARAEATYRRWGRWSLLMSWVPIVGDPLTVVAGFLGEPLTSFVIIVTLAKGARYVAVAAVALAWV